MIMDQIYGGVYDPHHISASFLVITAAKFESTYIYSSLYHPREPGGAASARCHLVGCLASLVAENWRAGMTGVTSSSKPSNARRHDILLMWAKTKRGKCLGLASDTVEIMPHSMNETMRETAHRASSAHLPSGQTWKSWVQALRIVTARPERIQHGNTVEPIVILVNFLDKEQYIRTAKLHCTLIDLAFSAD